jgi:hypothetical protein
MKFFQPFMDHTVTCKHFVPFLPETERVFPQHRSSLTCTKFPARDSSKHNDLLNWLVALLCVGTTLCPFAALLLLNANL